VPASYTGSTVTEPACWGDGFRGKGWTGTAYGTGTNSTLKTNVSLSIATIVP
jgi:hypothetical protein